MITVFMAISIAFIMFFTILMAKGENHRQPYYRVKKKGIAPEDNSNNLHQHHNKKPVWVTTEVIRLKAIMGNHAGCRSIADTFNRLHGHHATVGKSFVAQTIKANQYAITQCKRNLKKAIPRPCNTNSTWAMDLSFCTYNDKIQQPFIGILDHGSRLLLRIKTLTNKSSWTLLGHLCLAIGKYGKPKKLRTDKIVWNNFEQRSWPRRGEAQDAPNITKPFLPASYLPPF